MDYKISQIAKILNVSRQSIYSKLNTPDLQPYLKKIDNITHIAPEGIEIIKNLLSTRNIDSQIDSKDTNEIDNQITALNSLYINSLKEEIEFLRNQLNSKNEILKNFQVLLKQEQDKYLLLEEKLTNEKKSDFWSWIFKRK